MKFIDLKILNILIEWGVGGGVNRLPIWCSLNLKKEFVKL